MNILEEWEGCLSAREFRNKYSIEYKGEGRRKKRDRNATEEKKICSQAIKYAIIKLLEKNRESRWREWNSTLDGTSQASERRLCP